MTKENPSASRPCNYNKGDIFFINIHVNKMERCRLDSVQWVYI